MNEKNYSPELNANNDPFGPTLYDTVKIDVFIVTRGYRPAFTKEDIEDMTHEAYIKVCENRKKAEGHPNVGGWIYKVVCLDNGIFIIQH